METDPSSFTFSGEIGDVDRNLLLELDLVVAAGATAEATRAGQPWSCGSRSTRELVRIRTRMQPWLSARTDCEQLLLRRVVHVDVVVVGEEEFHRAKHVARARRL